jgi:hypothetical protein
MKNYNEVCDILVDGMLSRMMQRAAVTSVATSQDKQCPASDTRREEKSREKAVS